MRSLALTPSSLSCARLIKLGKQYLHHYILLQRLMLLQAHTSESEKGNEKRTHSTLPPALPLVILFCCWYYFYVQVRAIHAHMYPTRAKRLKVIFYLFSSRGVFSLYMRSALLCWYFDIHAQKAHAVFYIRYVCLRSSVISSTASYTLSSSSVCCCCIFL